MSLVSDRVGYLFRRYTAQDIATITGLPLSLISPSMGEVEPLEAPARRNLYNLYHRTVYQDLRAVGASAVEARRYRSKPVEMVLARLGHREEVLNMLAQSRFYQYKRYLQSTGKYLSDDDTLATLRESIARNMGRSKKSLNATEYDSYPTLSHGFMDEDV